MHALLGLHQRRALFALPPTQVHTKLSREEHTCPQTAKERAREGLSGQFCAHMCSASRHVPIAEPMSNKKGQALKLDLGNAGGRCWIRTSDPIRVKDVLYP